MSRYERSLGQAELLAVAVLRGDESAALALADEVLLTYRTSGQVWLRRPLSEFCRWTPRIRSAFLRLGLETVEQLLGRTAEDFRGLINFGDASLGELRRLLAKEGLTLRDEPGHVREWAERHRKP